MNHNIVAIVQARMGSTRLPGKVLLDIDGLPMLHRVISRLGRTKNLSKVVVATTDLSHDDVLVEYCHAQHWPVSRGDEDDVLDRYYQTAVLHQAEIIIRITSDCPLIDPSVVDQLIEQFITHLPEVEYMSNFEPRRTFPRGLDAEIMTFSALERAWREDNNPAWREHVTPYIYRHPDKFVVKGYVNDVDYSNKRWTVDTSEDLAFVRKIYHFFGHDLFTWQELIECLVEHPEWELINQDVQQKKIHD